jgi:hypothetical protein
MLRRTFLFATGSTVLLASPPLRGAEPKDPKAKDSKASDPKAKDDDGAKWEPLFNGKDLTGWKKSSFGGEGEVTTEDGVLTIEMGQPMSGITWKKKEPPYKQNYEIRLEAKRVKGSDFFCGLTFPFNDTHCSLICGGWGGGVVGLSSINSADASENATTTYQEFKTDRWYKIRVRVEPKRIQCWIDDKQVVDQEITDHKVGTRIEVDESKPLGISTYETTAAIKNFEVRPLK